MTRNVFDCRELPGECTMKISGTVDEMLETQAMHAVAVDDLDDSPALREFIRVSLKAEMAA